MTESLQNAFTLASQLPDTDQDAIAAWLLAELESESRWDKLFAGSKDKLADMAKDARAEHSRGDTKAWDSN